MGATGNCYARTALMHVPLTLHVSVLKKMPTPHHPDELTQQLKL